MTSLDTESDPQAIAAIICESMKAKDEALRCAIGHLEHMAAWLSGLNSGYSFECLGEDMPGIRAALGPSASTRPIGDSTS